MKCLMKSKSNAGNAARTKETKLKKKALAPKTEVSAFSFALDVNLEYEC